MVETERLRAAFEWVGDGIHRSVRFVFEYDGVTDWHYQVDHVYEHTAFGLSGDRIESLQDVRDGRDLWFEDRGDDPRAVEYGDDGSRREFVTLHGIGGDVDDNVAVARAILGEVYGVSLDDVEKLVEETDDPEYYHRDTRTRPEARGGSRADDTDRSPGAANGDADPGSGGGTVEPAPETDAAAFERLDDAVYHGDLSDLREALEAVDVDARGSHGQNALHTAVAVGDREAVEELLDRGIDLEARDGTGKTPLHRAVDVAEVDLAKTILEAGARADVVDDYNAQPLLDAVRVAYDDLEFLETLLERGCDPERENQWGVSPLSSARGYDDDPELDDYTELVELLEGYADS